MKTIRSFMLCMLLSMAGIGSAFAAQADGVQEGNDLARVAERLNALQASFDGRAEQKDVKRCLLKIQIGLLIFAQDNFTAIVDVNDNQNNFKTIVTDPAIAAIRNTAGHNFPVAPQQASILEAKIEALPALCPRKAGHGQNLQQLKASFIRLYKDVTTALDVYNPGVLAAGGNTCLRLAKYLCLAWIAAVLVYQGSRAGVNKYSGQDGGVNKFFAGIPGRVDQLDGGYVSSGLNVAFNTVPESIISRTRYAFTPAFRDSLTEGVAQRLYDASVRLNSNLGKTVICPSNETIINEHSNELMEKFAPQFNELRGNLTECKQTLNATQAQAVASNATLNGQITELRANVAQKTEDLRNCNNSLAIIQGTRTVGTDNAEVNKALENCLSEKGKLATMLGAATSTLAERTSQLNECEQHHNETGAELEMLKAAQPVKPVGEGNIVDKVLGAFGL